jgi:hypothetical protein
MDTAVVAPKADVRADNVDITARDGGIVGARNISVDFADISGLGSNTLCLDAPTTRARAHAKDSNLSNCGTGVNGTDGVDLDGVTITSSVIGARSLNGRVTLTDSDVTGSSQADLMSQAKPTLDNSTCDTSVRIKRKKPAGTWGVCAND